MSLFRTAVFLTIGWLGLAAAGEARAQGAPPLIAEEVRRVHADFSNGGTGRLNTNWTACVRRAGSSGDVESAERCLVYMVGAMLLDDSDTAARNLPPVSELTPEHVTPATNRLFDVMGVPPNGRKAALNRYRKWVFERHIAEVRSAGTQGGWNSVFADLGRPVTPTLPRPPSSGAFDPALLFSGGTVKNGPPVMPSRPAEVAPAPRPVQPPAPERAAGETSEIPLQKRGGTFMVPVLLNNTISMKFMIDSGASDVSISNDVMQMLMRSGTLDRSDFVGKQTYRLADGSRVTNDTFRIRRLRVGDREVRDVLGSVSNGDGSLLLGQSFLTRFKSWSIDNQRQMLVLK